MIRHLLKSIEKLSVDFCQFWIRHFWKRQKRQNIFASLSFSSKRAVSLKPLSCANVIPLDSSLHWNGVRPRNIRARYLGNELCLSSGNELLWCTSNPCRLWEPISPKHCFMDDSAVSSAFRRADLPALSSDTTRIYLKKNNYWVCPIFSPLKNALAFFV